MPESYVNDPLVAHLKRELTLLFGSARNFSLLALVALLAGISGPFGTYEALSTPERFLFWALVVIGTAGAGHGTASAVELVLHRWGWSTISRLLAASTLTALPVVCVVVLVLLGFGFRPDGEDLVVLYAQCAAVVGSVTFIGFLAGSPGEQPKKSSTPKLMKRLPLDRRGRLIRLAAQDHYVEVVTTNGRTLVSMRFCDAIAQTSPEPGLQVHRSHWVALHAVSARCRAKNRAGLRLCDDSIIPIGRKFSSVVRQTGLSEAGRRPLVLLWGMRWFRCD